MAFCIVGTQLCTISYTARASGRKEKEEATAEVAYEHKLLP